MHNIVVVGSLNADLVQPVNRVPAPGETILGADLTIVPGGKGANQATAAARLGGRVQMIGAIGDDQLSGLLLSSLQDANVDVSSLEKLTGASGTACIFVLPHGENLIVVSPAANGRLTAEMVTQRLTVGKGDTVLCQLEVPLATTAAALERAARAGAVTILDPAPAQPLSREILSCVTFLTPNQTEAALLLGVADDIRTFAAAEEAARALLRLGPPNVVVKLGAVGCLIANAEGVIAVDGFPVQAVDTTAAGDTFNGAFAVALSEGRDLKTAARFANAAGALSVTKFGAQSSIPSREEVDAFLKKHVA